MNETANNKEMKMKTTTAIENAKIKTDATGRRIQTAIEDVVIGMGATRHGYSDSEPFEVIAKTAKTVTVRAMKATLDVGFEPKFHVGGFCANCSNQSEQTYAMESDEGGTVDVIRFAKKGWAGKFGEYTIGAASKFYDYNF
jgi:chorismate synthase